MTVYLDSVFALNFAVNWCCCTRRPGSGGGGPAPAHRGGCGARRSLRRGGVSAGVRSSGGLGGQAGRHGSAAGRAFGLRRETLRLAAVFGGVTLALCGAVYGLELLKHGRVRPGALWYPVTFSSLVLTAGGVYAATRLLLPRLSHAPDSVVPVRLTLGGRRVFLSALRDSGNTLCDPVTGEAVLVADWHCAARLLPHDGLRAADFAAPAALVLRLQRLHPRLIPFRAVGTGSGLLLALPCEEVRIGKRVQKNGLVAFSPTPVSGRRRLRGPDRRGNAMLEFLTDWLQRLLRQPAKLMYIGGSDILRRRLPRRRSRPSCSRPPLATRPRGPGSSSAICGSWSISRAGSRTPA